MITAIKPWGNSHGIRISREIMQALGASPNEELEAEVVDGKLVLRKVISRKTLSEYARECGGRLGPYEEFDWGEGIGIERWLDAED